MAASAQSVPASIKAMGYLEKGAQATPYEYAPKPFAKMDADIVVTHNGVCATDKHMVDNDWGMSRYPLVPGHEVVGRVLAVGAGVTHLKAGDVVGLGAQCQACDGKADCEWCTGGLDNLCAERKFTYMGNTVDETGEHVHHGGFSSFLRTDSRYLFKIPEGIAPEHVGPLMCGGLTVAAPLYEFGKNSFEAKGKKIGVIGLGGLGHMAVQFVAKMGAEAVAISRGTSKKPFASELGATAFIDSTDAEDMKAHAGSFHYLLVCVSGGKFDAMHYIPLLRAYGVLHVVGIPDEPLVLPVMALMFQRITVSSSPIGSSPQMKAMLDFAAAKGVKPIIEVFPHSKANEAMQKVRDGSIRFRAVLQNDLV